MPDLDDKGLEAAVAAVADSEGWNEADMPIRQRTARAAVEAYLAALSSPSGVKVKELEWWLSDTGDWCVDTIVGRYQVQRVTANSNFRVFFPGSSKEVVQPATTYWPLDAAKAAAQADFDQRIRGALVPVSGEPEPAALPHCADNILERFVDAASGHFQQDIINAAERLIAFARNKHDRYQPSALSPSGEDRIEEPVGVAWNDEDMAMHWIDRYAGGVDAEPQMDRILDCVAALPAPAVEGVKVKELEWVETGKRGFLDAHYYAVAGSLRHTVHPVEDYPADFVEHYTIRESRHGIPKWALVYWVGNSGLAGINKSFETLEAAKAAAQADYECRIRSALTAQPTDDKLPCDVKLPSGTIFCAGVSVSTLLAAAQRHKGRTFPTDDKARVVELEKALEPFANAAAELFNDWCPDETPAWYMADEDDSPSPVTVGDFRAARRAKGGA